MAASVFRKSRKAWAASACWAVFSTAAMESYMESQESYSSLFEDQAKYNAVMSALAGMVYREMRSGNGQ